MKTILLLAAALVLGLPAAMAQDADDESEAAAETKAEAPAEPAEKEAGGPKTLSGMSILGNEETPKSLVIVPWKSSEMGDELSLSDTLDDRARPVDKEVFLRELHFYELRASE
jgi:hypothetical protein